MIICTLILLHCLLTHNSTPYHCFQAKKFSLVILQCHKKKVIDFIKLPLMALIKSLTTKSLISKSSREEERLKKKPREFTAIAIKNKNLKN